MKLFTVVSWYPFGTAGHSESLKKFYRYKFKKTELYSTEDLFINSLQKAVTKYLKKFTNDQVIFLIEKLLNISVNIILVIRQNRLT